MTTKRSVFVGGKYLTPVAARRALDAATRLNPDDAAYIIKVCDKFPQLVETLIEAKKLLDARNDGADTFRASAKIGLLLRELGELE